MGLPCFPPRDLPDPGIEPGSLSLADGFLTTSTTWEAHLLIWWSLVSHALGILSWICFQLQRGQVITNLDRILKKQRHYFANKGLSSQGYGFSSGHVWM